MRKYLHIHRLSHYQCHTLQSLNDAIQTFFLLLTGLSSIFIKLGIVSRDYEPQCLHYFRHCVESIQAKGVLPHYSTDRTEIHHKPLRNVFQRSNKHGEHVIQFTLKEHVILTAFQAMIFNFQATENYVGDEQKKVGDELEIEESMDIEEVYSNIKEANAMFGMIAFVWPKHPVHL